MHKYDLHKCNIEIVGGKNMNLYEKQDSGKTLLLF